jgi:hypothetical protein
LLVTTGMPTACSIAAIDAHTRKAVQDTNSASQPAGATVRQASAMDAGVTREMFSSPTSPKLLAAAMTNPLASR